MNFQSILPRWRQAIVSAGVAMSVFTATAFAASVPVPTPTVTRAPDAGTPWSAATLDIGALGYVQEEFFIEGTARSYVTALDFTKVTNGKWDSTPTGPTAPYKTRILVERPRDPAKFNGTVIVEWFNVTAMRDGGMFSNFGEWFTRQGFAYVGVSAQVAGVNHLPTYNAERYGVLKHPGDTYSFDVYSQAAQALKTGNILPLGDLTHQVKALIAFGGSQSGSRLVTYINAVHPTTGIYDAFVPYVTGWSSMLTQDPSASLSMPSPSSQGPSGAALMIRTDSNTPILIQNSENEATLSARGFHQQPDSDHLRIWEYAGTGHASARTATALGTQRATPAAPTPGAPVCENPPANGLNASATWRAVVNAMHQWVRNGRAPERAPRIEFTIPKDAVQQPTAVRDPATGIAKGGIRVPQIAVPIATRWGVRPNDPQGTSNCRLYGASDPWNGNTDAWDGGPDDISPTPEPSLKALYGTNARYVEAVEKSARQLVAKGWMLEGDVAAVVEEARSVKID